jgi:hypothetical protein
MRSKQGKWLLSTRTSRVFFVSSVIVLASGCLIVALAKLSQPATVREINSSPALYVPLAVIVTLNAFSALFLSVGMVWYWASFDNSRHLIKLLWMVSFLCLGWYSMSIYYFVVYRSQRYVVASANQ